MEEEKDEIEIKLEVEEEEASPKEEEIKIELESQGDADTVEVEPEVETGNLEDLKAAAAVFREPEPEPEEEAPEELAPVEDNSYAEPEPKVKVSAPSFGSGTPSSKLECMPAFATHTEKVFSNNPPVQTDIACPSCGNHLVAVDKHFQVRSEPFTGWLCQKCVTIYFNDDGSSEFVSG